MGRAVRVASSDRAPVIFEGDVLVAGGCLAGVVAARELARAGQRVILLVDDTFLGHEIGAWQRPWLTWQERERELATEWFPVEEAASQARDGDLIPLHMDSVKVRLENLLLAEGVVLLYASRLIETRRDGDRCLLLIANKSGRQAVRVGQVIDATEQGILEHLAGAPPQTDPCARETLVVKRTMAFTGVAGEGVRRHQVPPQLGVVGDEITIYPSGFSPRDAYVEVAVRVDTTRSRSVWADTEIEAAARDASMAVARHLVQNVEAFASAKIGCGSLQVMRGESFDPLVALTQGMEAARRLLDPSGPACLLVGGGDLRSLALPDEPLTPEPQTPRAVAWKEESDLAGEWPGEFADASMAVLSTMAEVDVAVVGGGTSGPPAARAAALEGAKTALLDMHWALGGTGTIGAVPVYWMTYPNLLFTSPNAFSDEIDRRVALWESRLGYPRTPWTWIRRRDDGTEYWWGEDMQWSAEVKAHALLELCREAGVAVAFGCFCVGALAEHDAVVGTVLATPYGPRAVLSRVTIDATGDGDVAAFAGADAVYGSERDRIPMWAALPFHRQPGSHGSNFLSALDTTDAFDYTRYCLMMRRRGGRVYDHGVYIAPRESRHILGEVVLTLEHQLTLARFPDTVCAMFSNYDMKGQHVADIVDFGVNPPHTDIEIPYRAIVSRSLDQILIVGKAFSLTHDACAAPRMQRDLQLLGGVAGMAAAQAVRHRSTVKALNVAELQHRLAETGNLPAKIIDRGAELAPPRLGRIVNDLTGDERFEWLQMLATERLTAVPPVIQVCCADADEVAPMLRAALRRSRGKRRLLLARLLLWHRCPEGLDPVIKEIDRIWGSVQGLPLRERDRWWASHVPEHGLMPEIVHLLFALSRIPDPRILPSFEQAVCRIEAGPRDYADNDTRVFDYVRMVAVAAERTGLPAFVPLLERLLAMPELQTAAQDQSIGQEFLVERQAYLVLYLHRALARCGRKAGILGLAEMLNDTRALIARSALQELQTLTGAEYPLSRDAWVEALATWPETFDAMPWQVHLK